MPGGFLPVDGVIQRSFGGGELAPALHARADQIKYATGLRTCRNFLIHRSGGVSNRPGLRFISECATASPTVQLLCYASEIAGESILIEAGASYLRFFKNGAAVALAVPPAPWDIATQYLNGDLVEVAGVNYYAIIASLGMDPATSPLSWFPMTDDLLELPSPFPDLFAWSQTGRTLT